MWQSLTRNKGIHHVLERAKGVHEEEKVGGVSRLPPDTSSGGGTATALTAYHPWWVSFRWRLDEGGIRGLDWLGGARHGWEAGREAADVVPIWMSDVCPTSQGSNPQNTSRDGATDATPPHAEKTTYYADGNMTQLGNHILLSAAYVTQWTITFHW